MFQNSRFYKFINKINPVIIFVLLLFTSLLFDGAAVYGVSNSSLVSKEKYVNKTQKDFGSDIHIGIKLDSYSEASRLSLLNPLNEYNAYRINENGRRASYISHQNYTITYNEQTFDCSYIAYDDKGPINNSVSANRFVLECGSLENLDKNDYVFLSYDVFWSGLFYELPSEVVGKTVKFSFDEEKEFIIGGIIRENVANESGLHFKQLFDQSFILFGNQLVREYGFNTLMFTSNDNDFNSDFNEFIDAYNKSFISFDKSRLSISSYKNGEHYIKSNVSSRFITTSDAHIASFFSILVMALTVPIYLIIVLFYDFKKVKLPYKIPAAVILTGYQLGSAFLVADMVKKGPFISHLSITLFTIFMIASLICYIFIFLLFNMPKKEKDEETNNG